MNKKTMVLFGAVSSLSLTLYSCASIPGGGLPTVVGTYSNTHEENTVLKAPTENLEPQKLLLEFLVASVDSRNDYALARQYLTPDMAESWEVSKTRVVESYNINLKNVDYENPEDDTSNVVSYEVTGPLVGELQNGGVYKAAGNVASAYPVTLRKIKGQWRIDDLPPTVLLESQNFRQNFSLKDIFFFSNTSNILVPDPRWIYTGGDRETQDAVVSSLMNSMKIGPQEGLQNSVRRLLPQEVTYQISYPEDGGTVLNLYGLGTMSSQDRDLLTAQIYWTLNHGDGRGPYTINSEEQPLSSRLGEKIIEEDLREYQPTKSYTGPLYILKDGAIVRMDEGGISELGNWLGNGDILQASVHVGDEEKQEKETSSEEIIAAVRDKKQNQELVIGTPQTEPSVALWSKKLSTPTWGSSRNALYVVKDGSELMAITLSSTGTPMDSKTVDISSLHPLMSSLPPLEEGLGPIQDFSLAADGVRAVVTMGSRLYRVNVGQKESGQLVLSEPVQLGAYLLNEHSLQSVTWGWEGSLKVGTRADASALWDLSPDGAKVDRLRVENVKAPVDAINAESRTVYVLDNFGLKKLSSSYGQEVAEYGGFRGARPIIAR